MNQHSTHQTLMNEARRRIETASTKEERDSAKRDWYALLYGNPQRLKDAITLPFRTFGG